MLSLHPIHSCSILPSIEAILCSVSVSRNQILIQTEKDGDGFISLPF